MSPPSGLLTLCVLAAAAACAYGEPFLAPKAKASEAQAAGSDGKALYVITVEEHCTKADLDAMAPHLVSGTTPTFEGDPVQGGFCVFQIRDTRDKVDALVASRAWAPPPTIETDDTEGEGSTIPIVRDGEKLDDDIPADPADEAVDEPTEGNF